MKNLILLLFLSISFNSYTQPGPMLGFQCKMSEFKLILSTENQWVRTNLENGIYENFIVTEEESCFALPFSVDEVYKTIWSHFSITFYDRESKTKGKETMHFYIYNYCWDCQKEYKFKIPPFEEGHFFYRIEQEHILKSDLSIPFEINESHFKIKYFMDFLHSREFNEKEVSEKKDWSKKYRNWTLGFIKNWKSKREEKLF